MKSLNSKIINSRLCSTLISVLFMAIGLFGVNENTWGKTLTGKVGIGSGKGSVYVEIYSRWWGASPVKTSETITSGSTSVDYNDVSGVNWAYCKFYATAANGYTFDAWYTNSACTSGKTTDNPKQTGNTSGNRTDQYWAKFTPNSYDVTLAPNGGSGSNQTVTATFDAAMPTTLKAGGSIVKPTKTGYTFTGYYDAASGGKKYYNANLTSARSWDKASTGITLYAHWTVNNYTITLTAGNGTISAGTTSITVTYDANTNLTSAITTPTKSGCVFDGYYTGTDGSGTRIIDEFGNIIANAGGGSTYTDGSKKWKYAGNIELFAKWIDKYTPSMTGANQSMMVDGEQTPAFTFEHVDGPVAHITVKSISGVKNGDQVISYDAEHNKIIAHNAGVAEIYFTQAETSIIKEGTSATYTYTVYKYNSVFANVDDKSAKVDADVVSSYSLTYTKPNAAYIGTASIAAGAPTLDESDDFYYTLTHNVTTDITTGSPDASLAITYNASTKTATGKNAGTGTIHLYQPETYKYNPADEDFVVTVSKYVPAFEWNPDDAIYYYQSSIANVFSTTGPNDYTIVSGNEAVANVIDNTLYVYNVEETDTFTVTQEEDYLWAGKTMDYYVTPVEQNNHVPFTMNTVARRDALYDAISTVGDVSCGTNGVVSLSQASLWVGTAEPLFYTIHFTGIPDKLSFRYSQSMATSTPIGATGKAFIVYESATGAADSWSEVWTSNGVTGDRNDHSVSNLQLQPTTKYLKFFFDATYTGYYKNIKVTELNRFWATPKPTLDFGTEGANYGVQLEQATFLHANAGRITRVEIVGEDASFFSVSPTTIAGTGRDLYNTVYLNVRFDNGSELRGETPYVAKLRIYDNNGHKDSLNLTGKRFGKSAPRFTWNANHLPYYLGTTIANIASSSNTDYEHCPLSFSSSDPTIAEVIDGVLHIYSKNQAVTITVTQPGNKDFAAGSQDFTFTPRERPSLEVPFQVNMSIYNEAIEAGSKCYWESDESGRVRSGNTNIFVDDWIWKDDQKVFTLSFAGTPDKLSFEYRNNTSYLLNSTCPIGDHMWEVKESADGVTWNSVWHADWQVKSWTSVYDIPLNPSTQYIQFIFFGNYEGYWRNINVSSLEGFKYLRATDGTYLSRGNYWGTQAVVDNFGTVSRISRFTHDNTNMYTRFMFVDNMQYLYEADNHELYTDDETAGNSDNLWQITTTDGTILTIQSGNDVSDSHKGQYITVSNGVLALTTDETAATRWKMEDYSEHPAYITAVLDRQAAEAAAEDFGSDVNTLAEVRRKVVSEDFEFTDIPVPALALGEHSGEYRDGKTGTWGAMDETISGLEPGFYRLEIQAFYRVSSSDIAWACHDNNPKGMESVLAYVYANDVKYPIQSIYDSYSKTLLEVEDESHYVNQYYPTTLTSADKTFEPSLNRYVNDVYVYVTADEGKETGTLHYGIKNPSYVPGAWLAYKNVALTRIARKEYIFEGTEIKDTDWETDKNWNRNSEPDYRHIVTIRHDVEIDEKVAAYAMKIENGAKVYILPTGGMTIGAGGVKGATKDNLILKASQRGEDKGQTGYLRVSPYGKREMPNATVELFSTTWYNKSNEAGSRTRFQCIGTPIEEDGIVASSVFPTGTLLYAWNEDTEGWKNSRTKELVTFKGYDLSQKINEDGILVSFEGLLASGDKSIDLSCTSAEKGFNLLANSYTAPISIEKFEKKDFVNADETIYFLNAGTKEESNNQTGGVDAAGKWVGVPIKTAAILAEEGLPCVIPSMQGFWVKANGENARLNLDYFRLVYGNDYSGIRENKPLRAPTQNNSYQEEVFVTGKLKIDIYSEDDADCLFILESESYDAAYEDGYDARKIASEAMDLFTIRDNDQLSVDATNSIVGTRVGVRTGEGTTYTMMFSRLNSENDLALFDVETNETIDINEGTEYTFFAEPNSTIEDRFQIVERNNAPAITTGIDNAENGTKAHKFIKDNQLFILKNGVLYNANGILVRK